MDEIVSILRTSATQKHTQPLHNEEEEQVSCTYHLYSMKAIAIAWQDTEHPLRACRMAYYPPPIPSTDEGVHLGNQS